MGFFAQPVVLKNSIVVTRWKTLMTTNPFASLRLREKVVVKEVLYTPRAHLGKRGERQMGFVSRETAGFGIVSRQ
jgi:hypothetical protein